MVYEWAIKDTKLDPNIAGAVCEELEKTGEVTPKRLLDASRPEDAPLHGEFEWDDSIAAEKYRTGQARHIITNLKITTTEAGSTKAYVSLEHSPYKESKGYESILKVMSDEDKRKQLLNNARYDMKMFKAKYQSLKELAKVFDAMNEVM